jgi:hypothetical protein
MKLEENPESSELIEEKPNSEPKEFNEDILVTSQVSEENYEKHNENSTKTVTNRHTSPQQQQHSTEYGSSPSSTTSSLNRGIRSSIYLDYVFTCRYN